jgi:protein involved in polysaccharide export with SLBB domain
VGVYGEVRRPSIYELKKGQENLEQVLLASGGVLPSAKQTNILIKSAKSRQGKTVFGFDLTTNNPKNFKLIDGDIVRVSPELEHNLDGFVTLTGEVNHPGIYSISPGETLLTVIQRAGGFTKSAYLDGSIFTRNSLRALEMKRKEESLRELEKDKLLQRQVIAGESTNYEGLKLFFDRLREVPSLGRMVISLTDIVDGIKEDISLKHGDSLSIPTQPQEVTVIGEVNYSTSHLFDQSLTLEQYIDRSGGAKKNADMHQIYVIKSSGSVMTVGNVKNSFFRNIGNQTMIAAGDTIVVPIDTERASPMEVWTSVTQVTSQIAITLASFKTLGIF